MSMEATGTTEEKNPQRPVQTTIGWLNSQGTMYMEINRYPTNPCVKLSTKALETSVPSPSIEFALLIKIGT
jgi:hypothetical protein